MIKKIYIHMIEGTDFWIPINAQQLKDNQYKILDDKEYEDIDTSKLFEFFPGDIVTTEQLTFSDSKTKNVAKELVKPSPRLDRKYWEFMFLATDNRLKIHTDIYYKYRIEIERIKTATEQFFYPAVLDIIKRLEQLLRTVGKK